MFCSVNPIMSLTLFAFSIWKDFVTFSELEHWMEEHLDFLYTYCWAFNSSADENESSEMFATDYVRAFSGMWKWSYFLPASGVKKSNVSYIIVAFKHSVTYVKLFKSI